MMPRPWHVIGLMTVILGLASLGLWFMWETSPVVMPPTGLAPRSMVQAVDPGFEETAYRLNQAAMEAAGTKSVLDFLRFGCPQILYETCKSQDLRMGYLKPGNDLKPHWRMEVEGSLPRILSALGALDSLRPDAGLAEVDIRASGPGLFRVLARYGQLDPKAGTRGSNSARSIGTDQVLARIFGESTQRNRAMSMDGHENTGASVTKRAASALAEADKTVRELESIPDRTDGAESRLVLRGRATNGMEEQWLIKDMLLDRVFWIPGDPEWVLVSQAGCLVLADSKGSKEKVWQD